MAWNFEQIDGPYGNVTEGPAWDGEALLFTSIQQSRIMRYDPATGQSTVYREGTNYCNGLMFDPNGVLYGCEGGARRVVRYNSDGTATALTDGFEGQRLNIPNDLAIDNVGRIWFTDPYYEGAAGPSTEDRANKDLEHDSVYRLDPQDDGSWAISRVTFDTTRPNGLLFSLDHSVLYVAQSGRNADEYRQLRAYPVNSDGSLGEMTVLHDFGAHRGHRRHVPGHRGLHHRDGGLGPGRAWFVGLRVLRRMGRCWSGTTCRWRIPPTARLAAMTCRPCT